MYPSWGNYGAPPSQSYGGPGPRKLPGGGHTGQTGGFGGFEASSSSSSGSSMFSSLEEQHRQQMEQLQMLHKKQLQSVLHHGNSAPAFGGGPSSSGFSGSSSWHSESMGLCEGDSGQTYINQEIIPAQMPRVRPPAPRQGPQQQYPPPPPPQPPAESQPVPPPPESQPPAPPENSEPPTAPEAISKDSGTAADKNVPLQVTFLITFLS